MSRRRVSLELKNPTRNKIEISLNFSKYKIPRLSSTRLTDHGTVSGLHRSKETIASNITRRGLIATGDNQNSIVSGTSPGAASFRQRVWAVHGGSAGRLKLIRRRIIGNLARVVNASPLPTISSDDPDTQCRLPWWRGPRSFY